MGRETFCSSRLLARLCRIACGPFLLSATQTWDASICCLTQVETACPVTCLYRARADKNIFVVSDFGRPNFRYAIIASPTSVSNGSLISFLVLYCSNVIKLFSQSMFEKQRPAMSDARSPSLVDKSNTAKFCFPTGLDWLIESSICFTSFSDPHPPYAVYVRRP